MKYLKDLKMVYLKRGGGLLGKFFLMLTSVGPVLCKETSVVYTHPVKWKDEGLINFLHAIEPDMNIPSDACICRNCRDSLSNGYKCPENYKPRWLKVTTSTTECNIPGCSERAWRCTQLARREEISQHLHCPPLSSPNKKETNLCDTHFHKQINPASYQWKCTVCSVAIRSSNYHRFRAYSEPELFQKHLQEHTNFEGNITACDKECKDCYRLSLTVSHGLLRDTPENMQKVKDRVRLLMNGCGCKSGCKTARCGCKKQGLVCGVGCRCTNCKNIEREHSQQAKEGEASVVRIERYTTLDEDEDIDQLMEQIFGPDESGSSGEESECGSKAERSDDDPSEGSSDLEDCNI